MISRLRGTIVSQRAPWLELDVNGVGYELEMPLSAFYDMPHIGATYQVYTHLAVREDAHLLYGFPGEAERDFFRTLLKVSGIGGKVALACLSALTVDQLMQALQSDNIARLATIPGIGRKTAQRMVLELRDKVGGMLPGVAATPGSPRPQDNREDALAALLSLGYKPADASRVLQGLAEGLSTEQYIRQALQGLMKG